MQEYRDTYLESQVRQVARLQEQGKFIAADEYLSERLPLPRVDQLPGIEYDPKRYGYVAPWGRFARGPISGSWQLLEGTAPETQFPIRAVTATVRDNRVFIDLDGQMVSTSERWLASDNAYTLLAKINAGLVKDTALNALVCRLEWDEAELGKRLRDLRLSNEHVSVVCSSIVWDDTNHQLVACCPTCGHGYHPAVLQRGHPADIPHFCEHETTEKVLVDGEIQERKRPCRTPLFEMSRWRRIGLAPLVKRKFRHFFKVYVADEITPPPMAPPTSGQLISACCRPPVTVWLSRARCLAGWLALCSTCSTAACPNCAACTPSTRRRAGSTTTACGKSSGTRNPRWATTAPPPASAAATTGRRNCPGFHHR